MWTWRPEHTVAPVHLINSPQVVVAIVEIVVAEEEEVLAGEAEEVDVVQADVNKDNNKRSRPIPRSIKENHRLQSVKFVGSLATLQTSVGTGLHRLEEIHLGVVSNSPEVETEVRAGQAVVHKDVEEDGSPQWLTISHMYRR